MAFKDLRDWITHLEQEDALKRVKTEVDWQCEIGTLTRIVRESTGHALLFENIKDYQQTRGRKLFTHFGRTPQLAMALGLHKDTPPVKLIDHIRQGFKKRLKPVLLSSGPVKENILRGQDVNLYDFPVPQWNADDGGRYMNTQCGVVTRDPDTGWLNVGLYRGMIVDPKRIGVLMILTQHWGQHFAKYRQRGQRMPVAVFYGGEPILSFVAATPAAPTGVCEYDIVGALCGEPVKLVKCETSDLLVPADAEIVVEGYIDPDPATFALEGPFREYTGYYSGPPSPKPVIQVECITHRNDPIFEGGVGTATAHPGFRSISVSAFAWNLLEDTGVPGVTDVWCPPITAGKMVIAQIRKTYRGQPKQLAAALWGSAAAQDAFKHVMVVEEDIDIRNQAHLDWAMTFRINAAENDIVIFPGTPGSPLDPSIPAHERDVLRFGCGKWARVLFDATRNWEHDSIPPDIRFVDRKEDLPRSWEEYGL
ncbi:MAG: UbiD family decarboxylase [Desulfobacterales bacterium]|nr:UbiD family decarboxylase [Desulfobacterales bacterium]